MDTRTIKDIENILSIVVQLTKDINLLKEQLVVVSKRDTFDWYKTVTPDQWKNGILCNVWESSIDNISLSLVFGVVQFNNETVFQTSVRNYPNARPITQEEALKFIYKETL